MTIETIQDKIAARRDFFKTLGMASAGVATFLAAAQSSDAQAAPSDADIVQFALNLEYLEAEFYTMARTGKTIDQNGVEITGTGPSGPTTGGNKVNLIEGSSLALTADQIGQDERAHVTFLRATLTSLGITPIAKPAINLNALGTGFESAEAFITVARAFEDVGVSAYGGAAPLISNKIILGYAARILATEAEHTANLRLHAALYLSPTAMLDGVDVLPPPTGSKYFTTDAQGLTPIRTPGQVLNIVFGSKANATSGGFFPNGVNGALNSSSAAA